MSFRIQIDGQREFCSSLIKHICFKIFFVNLFYIIKFSTGYTKYSTVLIDIKRSRLRLRYLGDDTMRYISQSRGNRGERTSLSTGDQLYVQCHLGLSNRNSFYKNTGKSAE